MINFNIDKYQVVPVYSVYAGCMKAGKDSGYGRAFAKGLIYENAGLTPTYLYDSEVGCIYVLPQEYLEKIITIQ
jgi:hypothetical protein